MQTKSAIEFANWLAHDQPELFVALYKRALPSQAVKGMAGFTDILSAIGTGLSTAASSVGNYLTSSEGAKTLSNLAGTYLASKAAQSAVSTNYERAQVGMAPAPIQTVYNPSTGQYQAVLPQQNGTVVPLNDTVRSTLISPSLPSWLPYAAMGGAALILILLLSRR